MTEQRTPGRRGHAAHEARRWAAGLSVGATVVLTSTIAAASAHQLDVAAPEAAATDAAALAPAPAPTTKAPPTTASSKKKSPVVTTSPPVAKAPPTTQAPPRKPVARSRASR